MCIGNQTKKLYKFNSLYLQICVLMVSYRNNLKLLSLWWCIVDLKYVCIFVNFKNDYSQDVSDIGRVSTSTIAVTGIVEIKELQKINCGMV